MNFVCRVCKLKKLKLDFTAGSRLPLRGARGTEVWEVNYKILSKSFVNNYFY